MAVLPVSGSTHETTNPTASFSQGTYNVCLTATNTCGSAQICHSIERSPKAMIAHFIFLKRRVEWWEQMSSYL